MKVNFLRKRVETSGDEMVEILQVEDEIRNVEAVRGLQNNCSFMYIIYSFN